MKILLALLALALPAQAQYAHRSNPGDPAATPGFITTVGSGACPGNGCVILNTESTSATLVTVAGTYAATLEFRASSDNFVTTQLILGYPVTNGVRGTGLATLAANATGTWYVPTLGFRRIAVYGNAFTSNTSGTIRMDADPSGSVDVFAQPIPSITAGTQIACNAGVSPCNVTNAAQTVLNANASRKGCFLVANDVQDLYCKRNTSGGSAASTTNFDFILVAGSGALKPGGVWSCDSPGVVWRGAVNCIASAGTANLNLTVTETQ